MLNSIQHLLFFPLSQRERVGVREKSSLSFTVHVANA
jgi:hypothetical protein